MRWTVLRRLVGALHTSTGAIRSLIGKADPALLLCAESVDWLRRRLPGAVSSWDLATTYAFAHALVRGRKLWSEHVLPNDTFQWEIDFLDARGQSLFERGLPLTRHVAPQWQLVEGGAGAVAFNDYFLLLGHAQGQLLGTVVYDREYTLYKCWGIKEIHLTAEDVGRVVWVKKGFRPRDPAVVARRYRTWVSIEGGAGQPLSGSDYPEAFLLTLRELPLYKVVR